MAGVADNQAGLRPHQTPLYFVLSVARRDPQPESQSLPRFARADAVAKGMPKCLALRKEQIGHSQRSDSTSVVRANYFFGLQENVQT